MRLRRHGTWLTARANNVADACTRMMAHEDERRTDSSDASGVASGTCAKRSMRLGPRDGVVGLIEVADGPPTAARTPWSGVPDQGGKRVKG